MATFVFMVTCLLCFFTCCLSNDQTFPSTCYAQSYIPCVNMTNTQKELCLNLNNYIHLLCNNMTGGHIPSSQNSNISTNELCKQIEVNLDNLNISNTSNNKTSCTEICSSFKSLCISLRNLKDALRNEIKNDLQLKNETEPAVTPNKSVSTMPIDTVSTNKRQKLITTSSAVNVPPKINRILNASSDNKIKSILTSSVLNNVEKKTTVRQHDFNNVTSKSFLINDQKEIPNHFPTTSRDEQQKSFDDTNDRNAKQKTLLPAEYNETPSSAHFMGYFLTAIVLCIAGYIVFHNKQKIIAFIIEGRNQKRSRRPNSGEYKKLQTNVDDVMSSLEKSTASQNYIY